MTDVVIVMAEPETVGETTAILGDLLGAHQGVLSLVPGRAYIQSSRRPSPLTRRTFGGNCPVVAILLGAVELFGVVRARPPRL